MVFNSLEFIFALAAFAVLYFALPIKWRNPLMLVASLAFYAYYSLILSLYLVACIVLTYLIALEISKKKAAGASTKFWLLAGIILNLGSLAFFKYVNFIGRTISEVFTHGSYTALNIAAPLGISFIVFGAVSYLVDVNRGKIEVEKSLFRFALYMSFFPKVIQGPIERAGDMLPQFTEGHGFNAERARAGFAMLLYGLFLKLAIADVAGQMVDTVYGDLSSYGGLTIIAATMMFTAQLYCDFAGYSLMAIGIAKIFGYDLTTNFRHPYLSRSVGEFWRRWHITLNNWLRDYLYIPLGGSRCSNSRRRFNVLVTFGISGLWHGADWGYVIWGLLNGVYVNLENEVKRHRKARSVENGASESKASDPKAVAQESKFRNCMGIVKTFILVSFSWLFFRAKSLSASFLALKRIFTSFNAIECLKFAKHTFGAGAGHMLYGLDVAVWPRLFLFMLFAMVIDVIADKHDLPGRIATCKRPLRWLIYIVLMMLIIIYGSYGFGVSASDFIYTGF